MSAASSARKAAKYAKQTRNAARVTAVATVVSARDQRKVIKADQTAAAIDARRAAAAALPPAGWYPVLADPQYIVWWDGQRWHPQSQRLAQTQIQS